MKQESPFYFKQIEVGPMQNYMYILADRRTREAVVVDPAWEVDRVLRIAAGDDLRVTKALVTHTHFDHVNGAEDFLHATDGQIYIHEREAGFVKGVKSNLHATHDEERLKVGDLEITFIHTPGHTPGSQCFLIQNHLVSGDTLFINACGRCDLPGGNAEQMYQSLTGKLMKLSDQTILLPGHNYADEPTSTLQQEKTYNPYLQCKNLHDFLHVRMRK